VGGKLRHRTRASGAKRSVALRFSHTFGGAPCHDVHRRGTHSPITARPDRTTSREEASTGHLPVRYHTCQRQPCVGGPIQPSTARLFVEGPGLVAGAGLRPLELAFQLLDGPAERGGAPVWAVA
jgi:hypothetical protein